MSLYLGIDPGASGAIAVLDAKGALVSVQDMPVVKVRVGKTERARVCASLLTELMLHAASFDSLVVIEKVGGMTGQSCSAAFTFGYGAGLLEGVLAGLGYPVAFVTPQAWKKSAGLVADKGAAREAAMRLWPAQAKLFARVKDDGRAEAALLARHGWQSVARAAVR